MAYATLGVFDQVQSLLSSKPELSLSYISKELRIERHTVEKAVRTTRGVSFRQYRQGLLLTAALRFLEIPNLSVKEIAVALGYNHSRDFSRFVRRVTGRSPMEHRRLAQASVNYPVEIPRPGGDIPR